MAETELSLVDDERFDPPAAPLTEAEKRALEDVEMRRAAATSGKSSEPAPIDALARWKAEALGKEGRKAPAPGQPIAVGPVIPDDQLPFSVSPSLHEGRIEALPNYDNQDVKGYVMPAVQALSNVRTTLEAVDAAHRALRKDTSKTPEQKLLLVATAAQKKFDAVFANLASTETTLRKAIEHTEQELARPYAAAHAPQLTELRSVLRAMPKDERQKAIRRAIDSGDSVVIDAALGGHPLTTGTDPVQHGVWTRQVNEKRNPGLVMRLDAQRNALEIMVSIIPLIQPQFEKAMRGSFAQAKAVRGLSDASEAALKKILGQE